MRHLDRCCPFAVAIGVALWTVSVTACPPTTVESGEKEPVYEFSMNGRPWKEVLSWLNEKTDLPIVGVGIPEGKFTHFGPAKRKYSIGEVVDLINAGLLANDKGERYLLIRRQREFVLVAADQKGLVLAPLVKVEELPKYSNDAYVCVIVPLKSLVAEEVKDDFAKSLSVFGTIVVVKPNALRITDQVCTIRRVVEAITECEKASVCDGIQTYSHTCRIVKASEGERLLLALLPRRPKHYAIASDDKRGTVVVTGLASILAKAQELVEKLIDGGAAGFRGEPRFETYTLGGGADAERWAMDLRKIFPESHELRITAVNNGNAIRVYGTPGVHQEIGAKLSVGSIRSKLIHVGNFDAALFADTITRWYRVAKIDPPKIQVFEDNRILVRGSKDQIDQVDGVVRVFRVIGLALGAERFEWGKPRYLEKVVEP